MKLTGQTIVLVPWFDAEGMKQWLRMSFNGEMDSRFLYKQIIAYIKKEFGKKVTKAWVKASCPIINERLDKKGNERRTQLSSDNAFMQIVEDFIKDMESNEDEDIADYILQGGNPEGTEFPVRPVPDTN